MHLTKPMQHWKDNFLLWTHVLEKKKGYLMKNMLFCPAESKSLQDVSRWHKWTEALETVHYGSEIKFESSHQFWERGRGEQKKKKKCQITRCVCASN